MSERSKLAPCNNYYYMYEVSLSLKDHLHACHIKEIGTELIIKSHVRIQLRYYKYKTNNSL